MEILLPLLGIAVVLFIFCAPFVAIARISTLKNRIDSLEEIILGLRG